MVLSINPQTELSYLDELNHSLTTLKCQKERRDNIQIWTIFLTWIPVSIVVLNKVGTEFCGAWIGISIAYYVVVGFIADFIDKRTKLARYIGQLEVAIRNENQRLREERKEELHATLERIKIECQARSSEMLRIEDAIRYKRKWRDEFDGFPAILERNKELDSAASSEFRKAVDELKSIDFREYLQTRYFPVGYRNYRWLSWRFTSMKAWEYTPRNRQETDTYDDTEERSDKEKFKDDDPHEDEHIITVDEVRRTRNVDGRRNEVVERQSTTDSSPKPKQQSLPLTNDFTLTERPITETPKQRPKSSMVHRKIKISEDLRRQLESRKIQIGLLGELAVMKAEKKHLLQSDERHKEPVHISPTDDGKGYDIQSWREGREIYIEVKTTVGDFWSNLYFTENEKNTMERLKEQYHLYRICNFDVPTGVGSLFIYAGESLIMETFEFNSHRYVLSERTS